MIHCIGDSHVSCFSGQDHMIPIGWHNMDCTPYFRTYRTGAPTAYNYYNHLGQILDILNRKNKYNDIALISAGEIDCRFHLPKKIAENNLSIDEVVNECVDRYTGIFEELRKLEWTCVAWGPHPSTWLTPETKEDYPIFGEMVHRNIITENFNKRLEENTRKISVLFLSIFDQLIDKDYNTKREYYMDRLHLKSTTVIDMIINKFKQFT